MSKLNQLSDEQLVEVVRSQDKQHYSEIIRRYEKKLLRYALFLISDADLAADAVQEGFIKAYINLNSFNTDKLFSSWIYRIVHNQAIGMVDKNRHHLSTEEVVEVDAEISIEDDFIQQELHLHLQHCLTELPLLYKEVLVLFYLEEQSYENISDILHISIGTVGARLNRAKKLVKKICRRSTK